MFDRWSTGEPKVEQYEEGGKLFTKETGKSPTTLHQHLCTHAVSLQSCGHGDPCCTTTLTAVNCHMS
jgi:hypothetical protein